jgi:hypothetical protein
MYPFTPAVSIIYPCRFLLPTSAAAKMDEQAASGDLLRKAQAMSVATEQRAAQASSGR